MQNRLAGRQLRLRLRDVGWGDLAGREPIARIGERVLQDADVVLLDPEIGAIARHVHVGGRGREQHRLFHHPQRFARRRNLALGRPHFIGGLFAIEERLGTGDADRMRRRQASIRQ